MRNRYGVSTDHELHVSDLLAGRRTLAYNSNTDLMLTPRCPIPFKDRQTRMSFPILR